MATAVIYHHDERRRAEEFCSPLHAEGYEFKLAPLGIEVGTPKWRATVESDLHAADAFMVFLTPKAVLDEMVAWRTEVALACVHSGKQDSNGKRFVFIPILLEQVLPPKENWLLPKSVHRYQLCDASDVAGIRFWQEKIRTFLPRPTRPLSCFISYSRDDASVADRLKADLDDRGVRAWKDVDDIPAGVSWDDTIAKAIEECSHLLLLVTPSSVRSSNVADEVGYARQKGKAILPLIFESAALPFRIHRAQAINFTNDYQAGFESLLSQLKPGEPERDAH